MKKIRNLISVTLILILLLNSNCKDSYEEIFNKDELLKKHFTPEDMKMLNMILLFFEDVVFQDCKNKIVNTNCYTEYFNKIEKDYSSGDLKLKISSKKQIKLFSNISYKSFNKIWEYKTCYYSKTRDSFEIVTINNKGAYFEFLKTMSTKNIAVKKYQEIFSSEGDISSLLVSYVVHSYSNFEIEDRRVRLILAIHYLTLNAQTNKDFRSLFPSWYEAPTHDSIEDVNK